MNAHFHRSSLGLAFVLASLCMSADGLADSRPNIILIFSDDQGYSDLGTQGIVGDIQTPHIDRLVRSGIRMTSGFVTAPQCMPSRTGILTGRFQQHSGVESNRLWTNPNTTNAMLPGVSTIATYLQQAGYTTGMSGKWGVGGSLSRIAMASGQARIRPGDQKLLPEARGFQEYFCGTLNPYIASHDLQGNQLVGAPKIVRDKRYRVEVQADAAVSFIQRHAGDEQPFFLYFAPYSPHSPFDAPEDYLAKFAHIKNEKRKTCLAMMACVDDSVGRIVHTLEQHEILANTMVWYISDNGAPKHGGGLNKPWSGGKGNLTDGGIRVPFSVTWPARLDSERTYDPMVSTLDVLPTCLSAAGVDHTPSDLDGVNLLPYLAGDRTDRPHQALFFRWTFGDNTRAVIRTDQWKLLQSGRSSVLYDLQNDPAETKDVSSANAEKKEAMAQRLDIWLATIPEVEFSKNGRGNRR